MPIDIAKASNALRGQGPRRIALVISSLAGGGAERVMAHMANAWAAQGEEVVLITLAPLADDAYRLDSAVRRVSVEGKRDSVSSWQGLVNNAQRIHSLRQAIRQAAPDVVVSFLAPMNALVLIATRGLDIPVVVSERNHPRDLSTQGVWRLLRRLTYPLADALVVQTPEIERWVGRFVRGRRIHRIPNPVSPPPTPVSAPSSALAELGVSEPFIVGIGRLAPQKGFDLLLQAFARSAARDSRRLLLLGEGGERASLEALARRLGLQRSLVMPGRVPDPLPILGRAEAFVLSSRYEGFPNALLEAMSCGLPVISFDCPDGPREILRSGERGVLVPPEDIGALAAALDQVVSNREAFRERAERAREVTRDYGIEPVMRLWDQALERAANG